MWMRKKISLENVLKTKPRSQLILELITLYIPFMYTFVEFS